MRLSGAAIAVTSLLAIAVITLTPVAESATLPFLCFRCGTRAGLDVLLNILLFLPLGVGLGLSGMPRRWALLVIVASPLMVEALQFGLVPGRFASARDIVVNIGGGLAGWQAGLRYRTIVAPAPRTALALGIVAGSVWIGGQAFTAWALAVVVPPSPWWAQIRLRDLGFPRVFEGNVVSLAMGAVPIRHSDQLAESDAVRRQVLDGAAMRVVVTGVEPTPGTAPILLLAADDNLSEIVALAQTGPDVFFRVRTRAATAGLRNPSLRLGGVFPPGSARDTVVLTASRADAMYRIRASRAGIVRERALAASPSWGWALLVPIPHFSLGGEVRLLTAAWVAAAFALVGFWGARASTHPNGWDLAAPIITAIAAVAGLALVPLAFGLPLSHWSEWLGAGAGAGAGWLIGRHAPRRRAAASVERSRFA